MMEPRDIQQAAQDVASANLSAQAIVTAISEPTIDSEGRDALRITIVVRPDMVAKLSGDKLLDVLVELQTRLSQKGEERPVIVEYATNEELAQGGNA